MLSETEKIHISTYFEEENANNFDIDNQSSIEHEEDQQSFEEDSEYFVEENENENIDVISQNSELRNCFF